MLEDNKTYRTNDGKKVRIGGTTKVDDNWVWSIGGDWYVRESGAAIWWTKADGYKVLPQESIRSIADHTPVPY